MHSSTRIPIGAIEMKAALTSPRPLATPRSRRARRSMTQRRRSAIEEEVATDVAPTSLLRPGVDSPSSLRGQFESVIRNAQDSVCAAVEKVDGKAFREDAWTRPGGGGGISRVLQDGNVWEKAGVNVSVVYGSMPPEAYRAATAKSNGGSVTLPTERVPFFAAGISSVMHPHNPHAPTMHFNYRYFETEQWGEVEPQWWFGGGTDITPSYVVEADMKHFHGTYKAACDRHDPEFFPRFKKWCDDYFVIKHRNETRGLGGIFFDDLNDRAPEELLAFSKDCQDQVVPSYIPLVEAHKDDPYTPDHKRWQQMRRGRYVEFNLVYDRGTTFGLRTGGRIESILMSLPLTARWEYDQRPEEGSPEAILLDHCRNPRDWV